MVRNEEQKLPRLLKSLENYNFRGVILCDTGSTDGTLNVAREWSKRTGIALEIIMSGEFVNFEYSRNLCRKEIVPHDDDWILLMDADFTLRSMDTALDLAADVNMIQVFPAHDGHPHNALPLLVRQKTFQEQCQYRLWTHEFLDCGKEASFALFNGISLLDHADGASRPEKLDRDVRLLEAWLNSNGTDALRPRALYYLARAYEDRGDVDTAERHYRQHNLIQTMTNYLFYARYRLALLEMKRNGNATETLLHEAVASYDGIFRREPLYYLARFYRMRGDYVRCSIYGNAGLHAPSIDYQRIPLFLEPLIYDWVLEEEYAFCLLKLQHYARARQHFIRVLERVDEKSRERVLEEIKACG